jgi:YVTN family beta-propeller protein
MSISNGILISAFSIMLVSASMGSEILVADERGGTITRFNRDTKTESQIAIGISPHNLDITPDGKTILAVGMPMSPHLDHATGGYLVTIPVLNDGVWGHPARKRIGGHPAHIVPDSTGRLAYVTDAQTSSVLFVDIASGAVVEKMAVGQYPHGLRTSPDGKLIAVANMKSGSVTVIDALERKKIAEVTVGSSPVQVAFDAANRFLFVSLNAENKVATIDLKTLTVVRKSDVARGPVQLIVTPDERLIVANQGTANDPDNRVSILNAVTGDNIATVRVGRGAHGVALGRDGTEAYVTNTFDNTISTIDLKELKEVERRGTGKGPNGIVVR